MWRSKKFIVITVLVAIILAGGIGGVVLAADNDDESQPGARHEALMERVCEIYEQNTGVAIDPEELKDAFAQVRNEMQTEALQNRLQSLVEQGKITQEQADEYQKWQQSRPDFPFRFSFRGHGGFGGMCRPFAPTE